MVLNMSFHQQVYGPRADKLLRTLATTHNLEILALEEGTSGLGIRRLENLKLWQQDPRFQKIRHFQVKTCTKTVCSRPWTILSMIELVRIPVWTRLETFDVVLGSSAARYTLSLWTCTGSPGMVRWEHSGRPGKVTTQLVLATSLTMIQRFPQLLANRRHPVCHCRRSRVPGDPLPRVGGVHLRKRRMNGPPPPGRELLARVQLLPSDPSSSCPPNRYIPFSYKTNK